MKNYLLLFVFILLSNSIYSQDYQTDFVRKDLKNRNPENGHSPNHKNDIENVNKIDNTKEILETPPITNLFVNELGYATWDAPELELDFPLWKQYIDGDFVQSWGLINGGSYDAAIKWETIQLIGFEDTKITKIKFFPAYAPTATYKIRVYQGENADIIYEQELATVNQNSFNTITLNDPVSINTNQSLWVGYNVTHSAGEYPGGVGEGVENPNSRLFGYENGSWGQTSNQYSWILSAYIETNGKTVELIQSNSTIAMKDEDSNIKSITNEMQAFHLYIDGNEVGETEEELWQYQYLVKGQNYSAGVVVEYDEGDSEIVEYEFLYNPPFDLDISPDTIFASNEHCLKDFDIFSNTTWTANENDWWIDLTYGSGSNDKTNTVNIQENTSSEARIGSVTIDGDFAPSCLLTIVQEGVPVPLPMPTDLIVNNTAHAVWEVPNDLDGNTLIGYKLYLEGNYIGETEELSWEYTNLDQLVGFTAGVTAVFLEGESDPIEYDFVVNTSNELEIDKTSLIVSFESGYEEINITSNTSWDISCEADWVSFSSNEGSGNAILNIEYEYNEAGLRYTDVFIHGLDAPSWKIRLIQAQSASGGTPPPFNVASSLYQESGQVDLSWEYNPNASGYGFYEDFETGIADNFLFIDEGIVIEDGYFKMQGDGEDPIWIISQYDEVFSDFLFETKIIRHSGDISQSSGVIIRASSIEYDVMENQAYLVAITQDGRSGYAILDGSQYPYSSEWWPTEDINQGLDVENILSIHAYGDIIDVYINEVYQYTINDDSYSSGYNAIAAADSWSNTEIWFDEVAIGKEENNKAAFSNFNIYRNNEFIGNTVDTFFNNQLPDFGHYQYQVSAVYNEGESDIAVSDSIHWVEEIPPTNTVVYILPTNQDIDSTGLFNTTIEIDAAVDIGHFDLELQFNAALIHARSVDLGDFITSTGRSISSAMENINNEYGFIEYTVATSGDGIIGPNGTGVLLNIDWEVAGTVQHQTSTGLLLKDVVIMHSDSIDVPVSTQNATVNIAPNFVNSLNIADQIDIIPNPNNGLFKINIKGLKADLDLFVINPVGAIVQQQKIRKSNAVNFSTDMDLSLMTKGVYFLKFINKQQVYIKKVIVN